MMRRKQKPYNNNQRSGGHRNGGRRYNNNNKRTQKTFEGKTKQQALQGRDKYMNMAQDALTNNDRVEAERFFQYADHFVRIVDYFEAEERKYQEEQEAQAQEFDEEADSDDNADATDSEDKTDDDSEQKPRRGRPRGAAVKRTFDSTRSGKSEENDGDAEPKAKADAKEDMSEEAPKRRGRPRKKPEASDDAEKAGAAPASLPDFIKNPAA